MPHQYKARDKKFHKMTRRGLVEQNAVTGEKQRITEREQDFELRTGQPLQSHGRTERKTFSQPGHDIKGKAAKKQRVSRYKTEYTKKIVGETLSKQPETVIDKPLETIKLTESIKKTHEPDKPIEVVNSTVQIFEPENSAEVAEPKEHISESGKPTEAIKQTERTLETPSHEITSKLPRHYSRDKPNTEAFNIENQLKVGTVEKPSRLHFTKDGEKGTKPNKRKKNTKYQQKFTSEKILPDNVDVLINKQSVETLMPKETEQTKTPKTTPSKIIKEPGKLQFYRKSKLNQPAKLPSFNENTRTNQQKQQKQQQYFTPEAAKPEIKPLTNDVLTEKPNQFQLSLAENSNNLPAKLSDNDSVNSVDSKSEQTEKPPFSDSSQTDKQPLTDISQQDKGKLPSREVTKLREKPRKLQFKNDEQPKSDNVPDDKKLEKLKDKADKYNNKLEKARNKLPSKKRTKKERTFDEAKNKAVNKLQFEKEILPPGMEKNATPVPVTLVKKGADGVTRMGTGKLHQKVYEVEHENVGVKAGHRAEQAAESVYRGGKRITRSAFRYARNRPYYTVEKLEKKAVKANIKYDYHKTLSENPQFKSNVFSRYMQKRKIKQQYARAARETKRTGQTAIKTINFAGNAAKAVAGVIRRHPITASIIIILLLLVFFMSSLFSTLGSMAGGGISTILASSYLADDIEIDNAELSYIEWETDLLIKIGRTEQDYPGYDEYRYQVDNIEHNPYELAAFLTALYQDFQYADIEAVLRQIFNEQYVISVVETVETRYYEDSDGELIPYDWRVLTVTLTSRSFTDIILPRMDSEQMGIYSLLMQTKGNRQYIDSPFDFNWLTCVSSYYGYRVHPTTGVKDYHKGIDIAVPVGTEIHSGHDGTVTYAGYSGDYGYVVVIEDVKGLVSKYAHCDSLLVTVGQEIKRGDVIALSGNSGNSTGPHLHLEVIKNGQYLNPGYFAVTNDEGLLEPVYGYPGSPMGDGSYAALIEEAERHLGKPYIYGSNGPNSFDCSSYLCYILTQSGVKNIPRTSAQGIYNQCTPIPVNERQPGDLVFFHSTYSTPNTVTHVGLYVGDGGIIHAGSPIQYTRIDGNAYWQTHLYSYARIN